MDEHKTLISLFGKGYNEIGPVPSS